MNGFDVARIYQSVHQHFTNEKWDKDALKRGVLVKLSESAYQKKPNKNVFEAWSRHCNDFEFFRLSIANEFYGYTDFLYNPEMAKHNMNVWSSVKENILYNLNRDLEIVGGFSKIEKNPFRVLDYVVKGYIHIETAVGFNKLDNYTDRIRKSNRYSPILEPMLLRVDRGANFIAIPDDFKTKFEYFKNNQSSLI